MILNYRFINYETKEGAGNVVFSSKSLEDLINTNVRFNLLDESETAQNNNVVFIILLENRKNNVVIRTGSKEKRLARNYDSYSKNGFWRWWFGEMGILGNGCGDWLYCTKTKRNFFIKGWSNCIKYVGFYMNQDTDKENLLSNYNQPLWIALKKNKDGQYVENDKARKSWGMKVFERTWHQQRKSIVIE